MTFHQKPGLGAQVNHKHPLGRALSRAWLMNESIGDTALDSGMHKDHGIIHGASRAPLGLSFDGDDRIQLSEPIINNHDVFTISIRFNGAHSGIIYAEGYTVNTA